jgi:hypothetical protein
MLYNQPLDKPNDPNAPYIDETAKVQGSTVPAAAVEFDQREIVEVIFRANTRGYSDFSGAPCAAPTNADLTQLRKAIEGFITGWAFIIDTTITFKVHGAGHDFSDLNAAMFYLRKYYITQKGHVILQLAGATHGMTSAVKYTYTGGIQLVHPNLDRVSIFGAPLLAQVPVTYWSYASNGHSNIAGDTAANLAMLRTKFATELNLLNAGITIGPNCPTPMHLDGLLLTGDGGPAYGLAWVNSFGWMNLGSSWEPNIPGSPIIPGSAMGLAVVGFGQGGYVMELGCCIGIEGPGNTENDLTPLIAIGCCGQIFQTQAFAVSDGSYMTMAGNMIFMNNYNHGLLLWPRSGIQQDGGVHIQSNNGYGILMYTSSTYYQYGPRGSAGAAYMASTIWKNNGWGFQGYPGWASVYGDFGGGTANANALGSVYAAYGTNFQGTAGDAGISSACSPAWGTVGNGNAFIG